MESFLKFCLFFFFSFLLLASWFWWEEAGVWMEINLQVKSLDSRWSFNRPSEMLILNPNDHAEVQRQNQERNESSARLMEMRMIRELNSDPLPTESHFNSSTLDGICEGADARRCAPDFLPLETRIRTAPRYNIISCMIHKSMSTILQAIMCFLFDEHAFESNGRVFSRESSRNRFCLHKNEYPDVQKARKALAANGTKGSVPELLLAIVRDPVDRFLSAFVDKCIRKPTQQKYCNGCRANLTCFVLTEYERLMRQVERKRLLRSFEDRHFFPQSWRCNFDSLLKQYKFVYYSARPEAAEDFWGQLKELLEEQNVPFASLEFIADQLKGGRTIHSTIESDARAFLEKRLRSSPFLMEFLVRMFYVDYKNFEYRLPEINFE